MNKFAFVMLNYGALDETMKCIESIVSKMDTKNYHIIVIDNGSPDGSGNVLEEKYRFSFIVKIILNGKNLGFSKGLNIGYRYAKNELGCNYIALINNDTILLSDNFCHIVTKDFDKYQFAVLGPHIDNPDKDSLNRNPFSGIEILPEIMFEECRKLYQTLQFHLWMEKYHVRGLYHATIQFLSFIYHIFIPRTDKSADQKKYLRDHINKVVLNTGLHGCYWVFSPIYVEKFDGLDEVTFAYCEEWLLFDKCRNAGLLMMYEPELKIFHSEHTVMRKLDEKERFLRRSQIELDSAKKIMEYILKNYEN